MGSTRRGGFQSDEAEECTPLLASLGRGVSILGPGSRLTFRIFSLMHIAPSWGSSATCVNMAWLRLLLLIFGRFLRS